MISLRMRVVEAGAWAGMLHLDEAEAVLDAMLDVLAENADDAADVMAKEVGDYWTHQARRALDGLLVGLREPTDG